MPKTAGEQKKEPELCQESSDPNLVRGQKLPKKEAQSETAYAGYTGQEEAAKDAKEMAEEHAECRQQCLVDSTFSVHGVAHNVDLNQIPPETQKQRGKQNHDAADGRE